MLWLDGHILRQVVIVVDYVGQVDRGFSPLVLEDGVGGISCIDHIGIDFPVFEILVYPFGVLGGYTGDDD